MNNLLLLLGAFLVFSSSSFATDLNECRKHHEKRVDLVQANQAVSCLNTLRDETRTKDAATFLEASRLSLETTVWLYSRSPLSDRAPFAKLGLEIAENTQTSLPASALGPYWAGVFRVMKCRLSDTGPIPTCFLNQKKTILGLFETARKIEPSVNGYGPLRIQGIIYREMPKITGGDKARSLKLLEESIKSAPNFSTNPLELAKLALATRDAARARTLLDNLVKASCSQLDSSRVPECEVDQEEAKLLLQQN